MVSARVSVRVPPCLRLGTILMVTLFVMEDLGLSVCFNYLCLQGDPSRLIMSDHALHT